MADHRAALRTGRGLGLPPLRPPLQRRWPRQHGTDHPPDKPRWAGIAVGASHCGAGCTLGDIIAEFGVFALGATVAGAALWAETMGDYLLAVTLGLAFQYFAITPMRGLSFRKGHRGRREGRHPVADR
jgi:hypothetical protein